MIGLGWLEDFLPAEDELVEWRRQRRLLNRGQACWVGCSAGRRLRV